MRFEKPVYWIQSTNHAQLIYILIKKENLHNEKHQLKTLLLKFSKKKTFIIFFVVRPLSLCMVKNTKGNNRLLPIMRATKSKPIFTQKILKKRILMAKN